MQWKVKSGVGLFQDEYAGGHGDTRQQAQPLNDPITGFEMDPGAEFRNLKWKGEEKQFCNQTNDWLQNVLWGEEGLENAVVGSF